VSAEPDIVILGAGLSGICMGAELMRAGRTSYLILEQSAGVGGTWWDNVYPGAQCDVRSHLYSLSFAPKADWSRVFAPSQEIQAYAQQCAERFGLVPHLRLGARLTEASYDEAAGRWRLRTAAGDEFRPRVFICSTGPLNRPRYPAGIEAFRGEVMHSARWHAGYRFAGKRVALIGSAASAVQIAPSLAAEAFRLTVFQRTPSWILPRPDRAYSALEKRLLGIAPLALLNRAWHYWVHELRYAAFRGRGPVYRLMVAAADRHRRSQVADPALRELLTPRYPMGCKRILITSDYYPALQRPNVELLAQAATGFTADGVIAADGRQVAVDVIVCATGFYTTELLPGIDVRGRAGATLADATAAGAEAYRGVTVAGFPNLFLLLGPNTGTGHTSVLIPAEAQARYVIRCLAELDRRGATTLEVRAAASAEHNRELQARLARTVWASPACRSWYKTAAGKIVGTYPGHITRYVLEMRRPLFADYRFEPAPRPGQSA
jgi:cation diffusion facilitator CzcD-associated flavoprotein CzcO